MKQAVQLALAVGLGLVGCPVTPPHGEFDLGVETDSGPELGQPLPDVGNGWPDASDDGDSCSGEAVALWSAAHLNPWLVTVIHGCVTGISCVGAPPCDLASCLRVSAGVEGCAECVEREVACTSAECADDCGAGDTADSCVACLCARGCVQEFEECVGVSVGVCAQCPQGGCGPTPLSPALIMVITH